MVEAQHAATQWVAMEFRWLQVFDCAIGTDPRHLFACVLVAVERHRHQQVSAGTQHARAFAKRMISVGHVLKDIERRHGVQ